MPELYDIDEGQAPGLPPSPAPAPEPGPDAELDFLLRNYRRKPAPRPLRRQNYGAGGIEAYAPIPEPMAPPEEAPGDDPRQRALRRLEGRPWAQPSAPPLFNPAQVSPAPVIQFGIGLGKGAISTVKRARGLPGPEPQGMAESLGYGFTGPVDPNDPLVATGMAFPPGSVIERGLSQAVGQGRQLARPAIARGVQQGRFAAAESRLTPDPLRLKVAGLEPLRGGAPPRPAPSLPENLPPAIAELGEQAAAIVERDRPGDITRTLESAPGPPKVAALLEKVQPIRQLAKQLVPAHFHSDPVQTGYVAQGRATAVGNMRFWQTARRHRPQIETAFGKGSLERDYKPAGVRFIGTEQQRAANAAADITGTLADIVERPQLYEMSEDRRALVAALQAERDGNFGWAKSDFGLKVRRFKPEPGGMHIRHIDLSKEALEASGGEEAALRQGAGKERLHATLAERMKADPTFRPETALGKLLKADDDYLSQQMGLETFQRLSGGLTREQVIAETHPALYQRMQAVKRELQTMKASRARLNAKQAEAIDDFLTSPLEDANLDQLQQDLAPTVSRGKRQGLDIEQLDDEIDKVLGDLQGLRKEWRTADPKPYSRVAEGAYLYYKGPEAQQVRTMLQRSQNSLLKFADEFRATAFGGDLSPVSIQGLTLLFSDPIGTGKMIATGKLALTEAQMAAKVARNPEAAARFTAFTGINPLGSVESEFAVGFVAKVPKVGKYWEALNEGLYRPLVAAQMEIFESTYKGGLRAGLNPAQAGAVAADDVTKIIPRADYRRLGLSEARYAQYRAVLTSVSFFTQPAAMMNDATKGLLKVVTKQTITPREAFAIRRVLTLTATVEAIAIASNVKYAQDHNLPIEKAIKESLNPDSGKFMALVLPGGGKIGMGGPFRSIIRAVAPREVKGSPVPIPFWGLGSFAVNKLGPAGRVLWEEARNRDYWGDQIRTGDQEQNALKGVAVNILQGLAYAVQGSAPLTVGTAAKQIRKGVPPNEVAAQVTSQFTGTNYSPETLAQLKRRVAVQMYPIDPAKEPKRLEDPYLYLTDTQRKKVREHPLVKAQIDAQDDFKGKTSETIRATYEQFHDDLKALSDGAKAAYKDLSQRRQDTASGKLKGRDKGALNPKEFREEINKVASGRRANAQRLVDAFEKFSKEHPEADFEELNPESALKQRFLDQYNNPDFLDKSTGAWEYAKRDELKAAWEQQYGAATVKGWLTEGQDDLPPLIKRYYDGLEKYRDYFTVRDNRLARLSPPLQEWVKKLDELEMRRAAPGLYEAVKRKAPPDVQNFLDAVTKIKKAMRRTPTGKFEGLDRWLFDYGYTPSTLAEQEARKRD